MAVTDQNRRDLYTKLENSLGAEPADTLMQLLPLRPADELLTTTYFHAEMGTQRAELKLEMGELRTELRGEMGELRTELRGEMSELRTELRGEMNELRNDVVDRLAQSEAKMTRLFVTSAAANILAVITAIAI